MSKDGLCAIVTGSASGLGAATAAILAKGGARIVVNYSNSKAEAEATADLCRSAGAEVVVVQGDVSRDEDCKKIAAAAAPWGRLDVLVNNAGTTKHVPHHDLDGLSAEDFQRIYAVNTIGPFQMIRACAPALKASRGCVVNISSVASLLGTGSSIAYAASKAALDTMTFSLARALGPDVRLNIVAPGYVRTPWQIAAHGAEGAADLERRFAERAPLKAAAEPQDVADAIVWLIEGARRVTGEIVYVDGGMHIASPR